MKHWKLILAFNLMLFAIFMLNTYQEHRDIEYLKNLGALSESSALAHLTKSFRQAYQNVIVGQKIDLDEKTVNLLPVKVIGDVSRRFSEFIDSEVTVRTVSDRPRNPENQATPEEIRIIEFFKKNPDAKSEIRLSDKGGYIYAEPIYVKSFCLKCHGERANAPKLIKDNYPEGLSYGYEAGQIRGVLSINYLKNDFIVILSNLFKRNVIAALIVFSSLVIASFLMIRLIDKKDKEQSQMRDRLAQSEKMSTVGQMAANVSHEILNPLSIMTTRLQHDVDQFEIGKQAREAQAAVLAEWEKNQAEGNLESYFKEKVKDGGMTYLEDDLALMKSAIEKANSISEEHKNDLLFFQKNIDRIAKIVDSIRDVSGAQTSLEEVDLKGAISQSIEMISPLISEKKVSVMYDEVAEKTLLMADPNKLIQVFVNVIKNGIQAMDSKEENERNVEIKSASTEDRIEVRITDSGIGVEEADRQEIFLPTFTTKSRKDGTGLGLAISRKIMREFKGDIEVEWSESGKGTTFLLWIPRNEFGA